MIVLSSERGPKPKAGIVEQKIATVGTFNAEQRCIGPESLT
jgi:hypothetical protein